MLKIVFSASKYINDNLVDNFKNIFYGSKDRDPKVLEQEIDPLFEKNEEIWYISHDLLQKGKKLLEAPVEQPGTFRLEANDEHWEHVKQGIVKTEKHASKISQSYQVQQVIETCQWTIGESNKLNMLKLERFLEEEERKR